MDTYMRRSPIYYAVRIQGSTNEFGWQLSNGDEIDEFAKKFNMEWEWNSNSGVLSFKDKSKGVKLNRPEHVLIGDVVVAYDDWGTWRVYECTSEDFEKIFIGIGKREGGVHTNSALVKLASDVDDLMAEMGANPPLDETSRSWYATITAQLLAFNTRLKEAIGM